VASFTIFPISAGFLAVLFVLFVSAIFRRRATRGRKKNVQEHADATPLRDDVPVVMNDEPESSEPMPSAIETVERANDFPVDPVLPTPETRIQALEKENRELKQELTLLKDNRREKKRNLEAYHGIAKAVRTAKTTLKKARSSEDEATPVKGKRTGKPPGKKGAGYKNPSRINKTKHWRLNECTKCGVSLVGCNPVSSWEHVIIDVERPRNKRGMFWVATKHIMYRYRCPGCGKIVAKDLGVYKHLHYGLGIISFALAERLEHPGTWDGVRATMQHVFGPEHLPTIQAIIDWVKGLEEISRIVANRFKEEIKDSKRVNSDETGLPMDGNNWWLWILVTAHVVLFLPSKSRGHETVQDIFEGYKGVLVSDFFTAYNCLDVEQQKCLAHVIVELKEIEHDVSQEAKRSRSKLDKDGQAHPTITEAGADNESQYAMGSDHEPGKKRGRKPKQDPPLGESGRVKLESTIEKDNIAFAQAHRLREFFDEAWGKGSMGIQAPAENRMSADVAWGQLQSIINEIWAEGPANESIRRLLERFEAFETLLFTYLKHDDVPPDNNAAERPLRYFVTQRKVSGSFINPEVMDVYAVLLSVLKTAQLNAVSFEAILPQFIAGNVDGVFESLGLPPASPPPPKPVNTSDQSPPPGADT
jgi:hypothetical protein